MKSLKQSIKQQQELLTKILGMSLQNLAGKLPPVINSQLLLNEHLSSACKELSFCKNLYVLDSKGVQVSSTMNREKIEHDAYGRNRSNRPYMKNMFGEKEFELSDSYISKNKKRPSLTAIQVIKNDKNERIGFLGVDYDLRELPFTGNIYQESDEWRQMKGDPSIRGGCFYKSALKVSLISLLIMSCA